MADQERCLIPACSEHSEVVKLLVRLDEKFSLYSENHNRALLNIQELISRMVAVEERNETDASRLDRLEKAMESVNDKMSAVYSIAAYTAGLITIGATIWGVLHDFLGK
jgi:hypothetical protein